MSISGCLDCIISKNMNISISDVNLIIDRDTKEKSFREIKKIIESLINQTEEFTKKNVIDVQFAPFVALLDSLNAVLDVIAEANPAAVIAALKDLLANLTALLASMLDLIEIGADPVGKLKSLAFGDFINDFDISIELKVPDINGISKYAKGLSFGKIGRVPFPEWEGSEAQLKLSELVMCNFLPLFDPLFELINEIELSINGMVEGLKSSVTTAIGAGVVGVMAETKNVISGINDLIVSLEKIISLIPPTNFMKDKMKLYFSGISLDKISIPTEGAVTIIDMSTSLVDCLFEEIIDIFV